MKWFEDIGLTNQILMETLITNINNKLTWTAHPDLCDYTHQIEMNFTHKDAGQFILTDENYANIFKYLGTFLIDKNTITFSFREKIVNYNTEPVYFTKQSEYVIVKENTSNYTLKLDASPFDFYSLKCDRMFGSGKYNKLNCHDLPLIFIFNDL